jgi:hypothetical protein
MADGSRRILDGRDDGRDDSRDMGGMKGEMNFSKSL